MAVEVAVEDAGEACVGAEEDEGVGEGEEILYHWGLRRRFSIARGGFYLQNSLGR